MPPRIRAPGELFSYNDHGICLAGFLVEEISGIPFESYVEKNLFQPLGMVRSSFRQRLASELQSDVAKCYRYANGRSEPYALDFCQVVPAAGLYTTAHDIARVMMAQLQYGRYGEIRILKEETAREMQQRHFAHHPKLRDRAHGFSAPFSNGVRALFHDGGMAASVRGCAWCPTGTSASSWPGMRMTWD
jgi:CubicO group peptidase (beta-lactamase class C family)